MIRGEEIATIIGKRIQGILVSEHKTDPWAQIFLVFDDGTFYELYGEMSSTTRPERGGMGSALHYAEAFSKSEMAWYGDREQVEQVLAEARYKVPAARM